MRKKIAFPFIGDTVGGSHRSAALLIRELRRQDFDAVALLHRSGLLTEYFEASSVPYELVGGSYLQQGAGGFAALWSLACHVPKLAWLLRTRGYDLVHANDGRMITSWVPAARLVGIPAVAHRRTKWTPSRLADFALGLANRIIAISGFIHAGLPAALRGKAVVVSNPFEMDAGDRQSYRRIVEELAGGDGFLIAFVGTMQHQKRPHIFLDVAARILLEWPDARFLMIGRKTDMEPELRNHVNALGLGKRLHFTGYREDAPQLAGSCDLLLAPAVDEGHGRALVEAMLAGVPVIAAASGGHREIVRHGETGILVPPEDVEAMAQAALKVIRGNTDSALLVTTAQEQLMNAFSPSAHAAAVIEQYRLLGVS
jgi:glycosyltransferase involved in cell wall biosynthesis